MIVQLNHVAIAVPDLKKASDFYRTTLGALVSDPQELADHGVKTVFVELPNTKIELITPLGDNSPISLFLEKNPDGGIHHFCYEVANMQESVNQLNAIGIRILGDGKPKIGAHGKPVVFLHPKDCLGTLIELEQI